MDARLLATPAHLPPYRSAVVPLCGRVLGRMCVCDRIEMQVLMDEYHVSNDRVKLVKCL